MALRIVSYLIGAFISVQFCTEYWYVGPVFALVVLSWFFQTVPEKQYLKPLLFFVFSTLIYALVMRIAGMGNADWMFEPFDILAVGVAAGSILLPISHRILLGGSTKRTALTSLLLILSYFGVYFLSRLLIGIGIPDNFTTYLVIYTWQGVYLSSMFGVPRFSSHSVNS